MNQWFYGNDGGGAQQEQESYMSVPSPTPPPPPPQSSISLQQHINLPMISQDEEYSTHPYSISPALWGPPMWATLHWIAARYPAKPTASHRQWYKNYYHNTQYVIPCPECQIHYGENLKKMPIDAFLSSGRQLRQWLVTLHNLVNEQTGSDVRKTLIQVDEMYPPADPNDSTVSTFTISRTIQQQQYNEERTLKPQNTALLYQKHQERVMKSNQMNMGRVGNRPIMTQQRILPPRIVGNNNNNNNVSRRNTIPLPTLQVSALPPKKKGCGCKKKK
jgi:hypothetical protein